MGGQSSESGIFSGRYESPTKRFDLLAVPMKDERTIESFVFQPPLDDFSKFTD